MYRNGARENDLICVSGDLGAAYMGLQLLEREKHVYAGESDPTPAFEGKEYILERQLKPEARKDIIAELDKRHIVPTAMMDISDGLSSEPASHLHPKPHRLPHLRRPHTHRLPNGCHGRRAQHEPRYRSPQRRRRLHELLFTVPLGSHDEVAAIPGVHIIGHMTAPSLGLYMISRDGNEIELRAQGWNSLAEENHDTTTENPE